MVDAEEVLGEANVIQEFLINVRRKKVPVAGCRCKTGELLKTESFRLIRDNEVIHRYVFEVEISFWKPEREERDSICRLGGESEIIAS